jgi:hypothetical protein
MSIGTGQHASKPKLPMGIEPRMLSFDVYGTLINTPPANLQAFRSILHEASGTNVDPMEFYSFWERRNVAHSVPEGRETMFISPDCVLPLLQPPAPSASKPYTDIVLGSPEL